MTQAELLAEVRRRLRDVVGTSAETLWTDEELIDVYGNAARDRLFLKTRNMVIDSTTAEDNATIPLCEIPIVAGTSTYAYSPKIIKILDVQLDSQSEPLQRVLLEKFSLHFPYQNWRKLTPGTPKAWCPNIESDKLVLLPEPTEDDTAYLTVSRFPLDRLDYNATPAPELGFREEYHEDLIPWILHLAFSKKDAQTDRPQMSAFYREKFDARCEEIRLELHRRSI